MFQNFDLGKKNCWRVFFIWENNELKNKMKQHLKSNVWVLMLSKQYLSVYISPNKILVHPFQSWKLGLSMSESKYLEGPPDLIWKFQLKISFCLGANFQVGRSLSSETPDLTSMDSGSISCEKTATMNHINHIGGNDIPGPESRIWPLHRW